MAIEGEPQAVPMAHFLCEVCGMSATIVQTTAGHAAWADHMAIHEDPAAYRAWTWDVLPLPFGRTSSSRWGR